MSRHSVMASYHGHPVRVIAGYDRPNRTLFLHVQDVTQTGPRRARLVYDSVRPPDCDWADINTLCYVLQRRGIQIPETMVWGIYLDQCFNEGNRCVEHPAEPEATP